MQKYACLITWRLQEEQDRKAVCSYVIIDIVILFTDFGLNWNCSILHKHVLYLSAAAA